MGTSASNTVNGSMLARTLLACMATTNGPRLGRGRPIRTLSNDPDTVQYVRMRQDHRIPAPPFRNGSRRAGSQGDQGVGGSDENILLLVVSGALGVMRVAQIVHRVDERLVVPLELVHDFRKSSGAMASKPKCT